MTDYRGNGNGDGGFVFPNQSSVTLSTSLSQRKHALQGTRILQEEFRDINGDFIDPRYYTDAYRVHDNNYHHSKYQTKRYSSYRAMGRAFWNRTFVPFGNYVQTAWISLVCATLFTALMFGLIFGLTDIGTASPFFNFGTGDEFSYIVFGVERTDVAEFWLFLITFFGTGFFSIWLWYTDDPLLKTIVYGKDSEAGKAETEDIPKHMLWINQVIYKIVRSGLWFLALIGATSDIKFTLATLSGRILADLWATHIYIYNPERLKPKAYRTTPKRHTPKLGSNDQVIIHEMPDKDGKPGIAHVV
ncbi:MAG: hypothetical protein ACTSUE_03640, partial [Promethearchaeota archaeon]